MRQARTSQRQERIERIVSGAFESWGKTLFCRTRLDDVAARLHMSKPALYRYFGSKGQLLDAMAQRFLAEYESLARRSEAHSEGLDPLETLDRFVRDQVDFFGTRAPYFYFMLQQLGPGNADALRGLWSEHSQGLSRALARLAHVRDPRVAADYLRASLCFFLMRASSRDGSLRPHRLSRAERDGVASLALAICTRGYGSEDWSPARLDFERIERVCRIDERDLPPEDPVLRAVAETVAEHGFAGASVERIARRAGLTKSSLYFYFRGRNEMFARLLSRHYERLRELLEARIGEPSPVAEKLYGFLLVLAGYCEHVGAIPGVLHWFRYHGYRLDVRPPSDSDLAHWFGFVERGLREGILCSHGLSAADVVRHLSFVVAAHVLAARAQKVEPASADLREVYGLVVHGTGGVQQ